MSRKIPLSGHPPPSNADWGQNNLQKCVEILMMGVWQFRNGLGRMKAIPNTLHT